MIRIEITADAFEAIAATPLGSAAYEAERTAKGEIRIWLAPDVVINKLCALRGPGESYSDVIPRLATDGEPRPNGPAKRPGSQF
jgi:hypothetical protein